MIWNLQAKRTNGSHEAGIIPSQICEERYFAYLLLAGCKPLLLSDYYH